MGGNDMSDPAPSVSATRFIEALRSAAEALSADLIPVWRQSTTDTPYTRFMTTRLLPATAGQLGLNYSSELAYTDVNGRYRRLDAAFLPHEAHASPGSTLIAIEIENEEQTLIDEIGKLADLRTRVCVLFFYSSESTRDRRVGEVFNKVRLWGSASTSEFVVMWNKPYQANPHWQPCVVTPRGLDERERFSIL